MQNTHRAVQLLVRRSKLYVPVNRERFVETAWTRGADGIILDLEDAIAPADKAVARNLVQDAIPLVKKGGADVLVRINRGCEEADLDAIVLPGLTGVLIPKCDSAADIQWLDRLVTQLEKARGLEGGSIQFELIFETAKGILHAEEVALASPRVVAISTGQVDLAVDLGFTRFQELNFEQYMYAESHLLYAARAAKVQPHGLGAQNHVDFTNITMGQEAMLKACRHAFWMGYMGTSVIHPGWIQAVNAGFTPPASAVDMARRLKVALEEAYARGEGSVSVDGHMYDVAHMKQVQFLLARAEAIARREAEKATAVETAGRK